MSPALTRRGFTKVGAAALGATVTGFSAAARAAVADPDAALIGLIAQHANAMAALDALDAVADPLLVRFKVEAPARPEALSWRPSDFPRTSYGIGASDAVEGTNARAYGFRGVEWLRRAKPAGHWPAASEARRREIVEADEAWTAERRAYADLIGLTAANEACDRQSDVVSDIEIAICGYVPMTLDGFRAKARWIASSPDAEEWAAFLLRDLCGATS